MVRLPRFPDAAGRLGVELDWIPRLSNLPTAVPESFTPAIQACSTRSGWAVLRWLDGIDAWEARQPHGWFGTDLGHDLASLIEHLQRTAVADAPVRAVLRLWDQCMEGADDAVAPVLLHGDLIPGNLLVAGGRLTAVLDWGGLGAGDPAQDLNPAWSVLDEKGAATFREDLDADDASWLRARGFALEQAIGGVIHYTPRRPPWVR